MNIMDVLALGTVEGITGNQGTGQEKTAFQPEAFLFSLFLNNFIGLQTQAAGQKPEEQGDNASPRDDSALAGMMGQNAYHWLLQNVFPAGKEANSGLGGEQSLNALLPDSGLGKESEFPLGETMLKAASQNGISLSVQQDEEHAFTQLSLDNRLVSGGKDQNILAALKEFGLEGIANPSSRESISLDSTELDKYIQTIEQLKELSGKLELHRTNGRKDLGENGITVKQELSDGLKGNDQSGTDKTGISPNRAFPLSALAEREGLASGQDNLGKNSNTDQQPDFQPIQGTGSKTNETFGMESIPNSKVIASSGSGKVWEQVLEILRKQDLNTSKEIKELSIHLQPAELGKVQVSLRMENGQIHLLMNASEQATGAILQNSLQDLKNGLSQMGVACGSFEMGNQNNGEAHPDREYSPNRGGNGTNLQEDEIASWTGIRSYYANNGYGERINVSA